MNTSTADFDDDDDEIARRADELIGDLSGIDSWAERDARYLSALDAAPVGIAKPNQVGAEAHPYEETPLRAEIKRRREQDPLNPVHKL
jgi:hypothetical protein